MRIIVCGGRDFGDGGQLRSVLVTYADAEPIVVHGGCPTGADAFADAAARALGLAVEVHAAKWDVYGRAAGPIRNEAMARAGADLCLAFGGNRGTDDMVARAAIHGIPVRRFGCLVGT